MNTNSVKKGLDRLKICSDNYQRAKNRSQTTLGELEEFKKSLQELEKELKTAGEVLLQTLQNFCNENPELYGGGKNFWKPIPNQHSWKVTSLNWSESKQAFRIGFNAVYTGPCSEGIVERRTALMPCELLNDPERYKVLRSISILESELGVVKECYNMIPEEKLALENKEKQLVQRIFDKSEMIEKLKEQLGESDAEAKREHS